MSSRIDIQKRCKWCGNIFIAHKTSTEYCSHRCANLAYKDKVRKQRIESFQRESGKKINTPPAINNKEYLNPTEASELLCIGRTSIYRYIRSGNIKVIRFKRKTLIRKTDIEDMAEYITIQGHETKSEKAPITDFYTTAEVKEKYHVNESWIFAIAKKHNIPRTFNRGKTYWSKKHIDANFAKKAPDPNITEWYSTQEMQEKFGMTLSAIYTLPTRTPFQRRRKALWCITRKNTWTLPKESPNRKKRCIIPWRKRWRSSTSRATSSTIM